MHAHVLHARICMHMNTYMKHTSKYEEKVILKLNLLACILLNKLNLPPTEINTP
jgi:hypothetical protein